MRLLLVAVLFALLPGTAAHAEKRVDWSQYLEKPGDRPAPRTTVVAEPEAKPTKKAKATKQRTAKAATKAKRKPGRRR
jgi:hypothetical protein